MATIASKIFNLENPNCRIHNVDGIDHLDSNTINALDDAQVLTKTVLKGDQLFLVYFFEDCSRVRILLKHI